MHRWSSRQGFTLIELMVVIAIIGVLVAIAFPVFSRVRENARQTRCRGNMMELVTALGQYHSANGRYPRPPLYNTTTEKYEGGFSDLYPDYIQDQELFICPDDRKAKLNLQDCYDRIYCSYNGIADWDDDNGDGSIWDLKYVLYNYHGYTFCCQLDDNGEETCDCSGLPGCSSGYDVGSPGITLALIRPGEALDWMDVVNANGDPSSNGIPDWLDQAGLSWRHFPALRSNQPPDTTIVTHCPYHREYYRAPEDELDLIVRLTGETDVVNLRQLGDPNETGAGAGIGGVDVSGWVHHNF